jgi:ABC-type bacteriocin/lantibiotic exporter with double-glycine peptidase domain
MTKEEIVSEVGRPILRPLSIAHGISLLLMVISPFIWIWHSWSLAWKVGLTGILGTIIILAIYKIAKKTVVDAVEQAMKDMKESSPKSKFVERIEKLQKEREGDMKK